MGWIRACAVLGACGLFGCGPAVDLDDGDTTSSGDVDASTTAGTTAAPGTTTMPGTTSTTSATTIDPDPDSDSGTSGFDEDDCGQDCCGFLCPPEEGGDDIGFDCDSWLQDCPEGEKCMPWANDGGRRWNSSRCAPLSEGPRQIGDPCMVEGSYMTGIDDCDVGLMCFFVDPLTNIGSCVTNCMGSEASPSCEDPNATCVIDFDGVFHECLPVCDPLLQDCEASGCYALGEEDIDAFVCAVPIAEPVVADFEPCDHQWSCAPGSLCTTEAMEPSCDDGRCCAPMCDLTLPNACDEGYVCTAVLPEREAPPEWNVGYCALP